ncbi:hypothetical protein ES703_03182 [subsurface metagenome]|nr:hypothetical protein [bacterium]
MNEDDMAIKKIFAVGVLAFAILLGCSVNELGIEKPNYFPLDDGNAWVYEVQTDAAAYTIVCEMIELEPGIFGYHSYIQTDQPSIMAAEFPEATEPFDDSAKVIIDSALAVPQWGWVIPINPVEIADQASYTVKTPAGTFEECIFIQGKKDADGTRFDAWLAPEIGPVYISQRSDDETLLKELRLLRFLPAS